jgi:hypothetical protein
VCFSKGVATKKGEKKGHTMVLLSQILVGSHFMGQAYQQIWKNIL